jgi:hypothetical protein
MKSQLNEIEKLQKIAGLLNENIEVIKHLASNYKALKRAIDSPNYPDTPYTRAALIKVEDKIKQMAKKEEFKQEFEKLLPDFKF